MRAIQCPAALPLAAADLGFYTSRFLLNSGTRCEGSALRIDATYLSTALRWEKLRGQRADHSRREIISCYERRHPGTFAADCATQDIGSFGGFEEEALEGQEEAEEDQNGDAGIGDESTDDENAEIFGDKDDEEYQRLRKVEVSWTFQKLTKQGGLSNLREAEEEVAALEDEGISVDAKLATDLINAYIKCGKNDLALAMFNKYFEEGDLQVDDVVVGVLLRGLGSASPPDWSQISSLLGRMEKMHKLSLSVVVYNELLSICSKSNAVRKGMKIIEEMAAKGLEADYGTLASVKHKKSLRSHLKKIYSTFGGRPF